MDFDFDKLWATVLQVWNDGLFGVDVGRILAALAIFIGFLAIRRFFAGAVLRRLQVWTEKSETTFDDDLLKVIDGPLRLVPVVIGAFFAIEHLQLTGAPGEAAGTLVRSLIAFAIFWTLFRAVDPLSALFEPLAASCRRRWSVGW